MKASILVCTRNRCRSLARLLKAAKNLEVPEQADWELLVVDNGSSDGTPELLSKFSGQLPLRTIVEPEPGLSRARNAGVREAAGDILVFTDDDVTFERDWLANYLGAFDRKPDTAFMGAGVIARMPNVTPQWAKAALRAAPSAFAHFQVGPQDEELVALRQHRRFPFGANMAFRKDIARRFEFNVCLGRRPGPHVISGEETELMSAMIRAGHRGRLIANNPVYHWIEVERQTLDYLGKFYYGQGYQQSAAIRASALITSRKDFWLSAGVWVFMSVLERSVGAFGPTLAKVWLRRQAAHFAGRREAWAKTAEPPGIWQKHD